MRPTYRKYKKKDLIDLNQHQMVIFPQDYSLYLLSSGCAFISFYAHSSPTKEESIGKILYW